MLKEVKTLAATMACCHKHGPGEGVLRVSRRQPMAGGGPRAATMIEEEEKEWEDDDNFNPGDQHEAMEISVVLSRCEHEAAVRTHELEDEALRAGISQGLRTAYQCTNGRSLMTYQVEKEL